MNEILNRFVRFLPRRGTTKEHILLYRTDVILMMSAKKRKRSRSNTVKKKVSHIFDSYRAW